MSLRQLSIHTGATISQKLPQEHEEKLINFQKLVILLRKKQGYCLSQIRNADQAQIWFNTPEPTTTQNVGERSVQKKDRCG
jgi:hypothetical protein